jgi:hypothetical protein
MVPGIARADGFGISYWDQGITGWQSEETPFLRNLQQTSYSNAFNLTDGYGEFSQMSASIANGGLHVYSSVSVPAAPLGGAGAYNGVNEYWWDTLRFSQAGVVRISVTLDGGVSGSANPALSLALNQAQFSEGGNEFCDDSSCPDSQYLPLATVNPNLTTTFLLSVDAGDHAFGEFLQVRNEVQSPACGTDDAGYRGCSQIIDDSTTAFFTVTPVTPGLTFTSASGFSYAGDPDQAQVPEPASILLVGAGLLSGIIWRGKRKQR